MSRKNFVSLILSSIGLVFLVVGICLMKISEWGAFWQGLMIVCVGAAVLIVMGLIRHAMAEKTDSIPLKGRAVAAIVLGLAGALVLGIGMVMTIAWGMTMQGILIGLIGIIFLLCMLLLVRKVQ